MEDDRPYGGEVRRLDQQSAQTDMSEAILDQPPASSQLRAYHRPMREPSRDQSSQLRPELTANPQS